MIIVNFGDYDIGVWFNHVRADDPDFRDGTNCLIYVGDAGSKLRSRPSVACGHSLVNPKDKNFNRGVGRHVSFFRALENSPLSKEERGSLVEKVRNSCKLIDPKYVK